MEKNHSTRNLAAAGILAAFTQLALAQSAQAQSADDSSASASAGDFAGEAVAQAFDVLQEFYDRLFDSQNN